MSSCLSGYPDLLELHRSRLHATGGDPRAALHRSLLPAPRESLRLTADAAMHADERADPWATARAQVQYQPHNAVVLCSTMIYSVASSLRCHSKRALQATSSYYSGIPTPRPVLSYRKSTFQGRFVTVSASSQNSSSDSRSDTGGSMADPREFQTGSGGGLHVHEGLLPTRARGAVFDLDGTLLDTNERRVASWQEACSRHGLSIDKDKYMALTGMSGKDIVQTLCKEQGKELSDHDVEELVKEESRLFKERGLPHSAAVTPVLDILDEARRRGLKVAVCSGGRKDAVERSLAERGLAERVDAVVTSADVPHAKPEPDIFALAAEKLGLQPGECVAFEDAQMGIRSARAAGYMSVVDVTRLPGHPQQGDPSAGNRGGRT